MIGFITNDDNDLMLDTRGNIRMEGGAECYRQNLVNRLRLQKYEYPYDLDRGINWLGNAFGMNGNLALWQAEVLDLLGEIEYIDSMDEWILDIEDGNLLFLLTVGTQYGKITIKG